MIVVDTSVWITHLRNVMTPEVNYLRNTVDPDTIIVGDMVLLEVLQGAFSERQARLIETELRVFAMAQMLNERIALLAAQNYRLLRAKGFTVRKSADLIIGTFCIEEGHSLLHNDRDFVPMSEHLGLRTINP